MTYKDLLVIQKALSHISTDLKSDIASLRGDSENDCMSKQLLERLKEVDEVYFIVQKRMMEIENELSDDEINRDIIEFVNKWEV